MATAHKKILVYLVLTFAFSSIFYYRMITAGAIGGYTFPLMWCPGVAAILTQLLFQHNLRGMWSVISKAKYLLVGYGLPLLYCLVVYGIVWLTGLGRVDLAEFMRQAAPRVDLPIQSPALYLLGYVLIMTTVALAIGCVQALGEEIGWRGFLVPELYKEHSFTQTGLISGVIWMLWHSPLILFADYNNAGAPRWFGLLCFVVMVVMFSFTFAWLRLKAASLWPAVLLHASHNMFVQTIFTPLTSDTGYTAYVVDEFGIGLAIALALLGYLFWRKRGELTRPFATVPSARLY